MPTFSANLNYGYKLQLVVSVQSQNSSARTTTFAYTLRIVQGGSWSGEYHLDGVEWTVRAPGSTVFDAGTRTPAYDFRNTSTWVLRSGTKTFSHGADGTYSAEWRGVFGGAGTRLGAGTASGTVTAPAFNPLPPSGLSVKRASDGKHDLSWTRGATYTGVTVQRQRNSEGTVTAGAPSGNLSAWSDTGTVTDSRYRWRVAGRVGSKTSAYTSWTGWVYTTPGKPSGVVAERDGDDIRVSIGGMPPYASHFDVYDNGVLVGSAVARAQFPWTHTSPDPVVTHQYTVRGRVASGGSSSSTLIGSLSDPSNTVQLITRPNPPSNLAPNGGVRVVDDAVVFSWQHNPVDSSPQSAYELRYRALGGSWTTVSGTTASTRSVALTAGEYEWQTRTKGAHPDWSDWSAVATVAVIDRPVVSILSPEEGPFTSATLTVEWDFYQEQSRPQSAWRVRLLTADGLVEERSGSGASSSVALHTRLVDETVYTVEVDAATGGVWSEASVEIETDFIPPAPALFSASWNESSGVVDITVGPDPEPSDAPAVLVTVERSVDGESWTLYQTVEDEANLSDPEALSNGVTFYRVTSVAATGAATPVTHEVEADSDCVYLSGGEGFNRTIRLPYNPQPGLTPWRERGRHFFLGRTYPVAWSGEHVSTGVTGAGMIYENDPAMASVDEFEQLLLSDSPVFMYRDPDGRRRYGVLSGDTRRVGHARWEFSFALDETERG